jgi:glycosyltransferase involved in cell wall biosynthesis
MRILFLTHYFPPEVNAPATRTYEHCREWVRAGHHVEVITCVPSHPKGVPFAGYRPAWYHREVVDGIVVHRVWTFLAANRGVNRRIANFLSYVPSAVFRMCRLERFDVVVGTSPQFFCAAAARVGSALRGVPWVFELRDLWPESIPAVGAMRKSVLLRALERIELQLYRDAAAVVCVTNAFIDNLRRRGVSESKLAYIPNGVNADFWRSGRGAHARLALGLSPDHFVVSYAGTIGMAHGIDTVLDAAATLKTAQPRVRLLVAGDGAELGRLRRRAADEGLDNVLLPGLLPRERMPDLLAASDAALVTLKRADVFKTVLPSKMFEAMAAARPTILMVEGEARDVLLRAGAGIAVRPGDAWELCMAIERLGSDAAVRARMGSAGAAFIEREFDRAHWAHRYLDVLAAAAAGRRLAPEPAEVAAAGR